MSNAPAAEALAQVLEDSRWLPHQLNAEGQLVLVETSRQKLASLPFVDGREPFATGSGLIVQLADALAAKWQRPPGPDRMIFHMAFCGSTLLATLLDQPGKTFVLREPNLLADLANMAHPASRDEALRALPIVCDLLRRRWSKNERTVVKPSNWVNPLLPQLTDPGQDVRSIFITIEPHEYLMAVFRGGRPRLEFVVRSAFHFLEGRRDRNELLAEAIAPADPLARAARFALLAHKLQADLFREAIKQRGWTDECRLSFAMIDHDPLASAIKAAKLLGLTNQAGEIEQAWFRIKGRNVKQNSAGWSPDERSRIDREVEAEHGRRFREALIWYEQQLETLDVLAA